MSKWPKCAFTAVVSVTDDIWNPRPHIAYSLCNFQGAAVTLKGSLLMSLPIIKRFGAMHLRRVT